MAALEDLPEEIAGQYCKDKECHHLERQTGNHNVCAVIQCIASALGGCRHAATNCLQDDGYRIARHEEVSIELRFDARKLRAKGEAELLEKHVNACREERWSDC